MGQEDVIQILKTDKDRWFSVRELQSTLDFISPGSVCVSVRKLRDAAMVHHKIEKIPKPLKGGKIRYHMTYIRYKED